MDQFRLRFPGWFVIRRNKTEDPGCGRRSGLYCMGLSRGGYRKSSDESAGCDRPSVLRERGDPIVLEPATLVVPFQDSAPQ